MLRGPDLRCGQLRMLDLVSQTHLVEADAGGVSMSRNRSIDRMKDVVRIEAETPPDRYPPLLRNALLVEEGRNQNVAHALTKTDASTRDPLPDLVPPVAYHAGGIL